MDHKAVRGSEDHETRGAARRRLAPGPAAPIGPRVAMGVLRAIALEVAGAVDVEAMLRSERIDPAAVSVDARALLRVLDRIAYALPDRGFALRAGQRAGMGVFGAVEYAARSARTLEEALGLFTEFFGSISTLATAALIPSGAEAHLRFTPASPGSPVTGAPWLPEYTAAAITRAIRDSVGGAWRPLRVRFAHGIAAAPAEYQRVFECAVDFGAPADELVLRAADLARPLVTANPAVAAALTSLLAATREARPLAESSLDDVRAAIRQELARGRETQRVVAERWKVSTRTLQRHVSALRATLSQLVDEERYHAARDLLEHTRTPIAEIAAATGFTSAAAFSRAFSRWAGMQPRAYRRARKLPPG